MTSEILRIEKNSEKILRIEYFKIVPGHKPDIKYSHN